MLRRGGAKSPLDERVQGQAAPLAIIIAAHDDEDIFDRDDEDERPEDKADDAVEIGDVESEMVARIERRLERVEGRSADIAVHDADRAQHHER